MYNWLILYILSERKHRYIISTSHQSNLQGYCVDNPLGQETAETWHDIIIAKLLHCWTQHCTYLSLYIDAWSRNIPHSLITLISPSLDLTLRTPSLRKNNHDARGGLTESSNRSVLLGSKLFSFLNGCHRILLSSRSGLILANSRSCRSEVGFNQRY